MKKYSQIRLIGVLFLLAAISISFYYNLGDNHKKFIPGKVTGDENGYWFPGDSSGHKSTGGGAATYMVNDTGWLYYIGGDVDFHGHLIADNRRYNLVTNHWQYVTPCPYPILYPGCARVRNYIFIIGGMKDSTFMSETDTVQQYNIYTNTWTQLSNVPQVLAFSKAVGYQDSLVYCAGGMTNYSDSAVNNVYIYNAASNQWRSASPLPVPLMGGAFTVNGDSLFYIGGGTTYYGPFSKTVYKGLIDSVDRSQISWDTVAPYPGVNTIRFDAAPWGARGIIIGGGSPTTFGSSNEAYIFFANTWYALGTMLHTAASTGGGSVVFSSGMGKFILAFGEDYPDSPFTISNNQVYNDTTYNWTPPAYPCQGFDTTLFPPFGWVYVHENGNYNWITRQLQSGFGLGIGSIMFNYYNAPIGHDGNLITSSFYPTSQYDSLKFDLAYCMASNEDSLLIYSSTDGGLTYTTLFAEGGSQLQTTSSCTHPYNNPQISDWIRTGAELPAGTNRLWIQSCGGFGDNLWLDSICVYHWTGINHNGNQIPLVYSLSQNYPNPFNPSTTIKFSLPRAGNVELKVYDILGKEVITLVNEYKHPGYYSVQFNANNYASGVYFFKLKSNDFIAVKKMVLIK